MGDISGIMEHFEKFKRITVIKKRNFYKVTEKHIGKFRPILSTSA